MTRAFSDDLRSRVLAASRDGMSARSAAARFGIGISTAIAWIASARAGQLPQTGARGQTFIRLQDKPHALQPDTQRKLCEMQRRVYRHRRLEATIAAGAYIESRTRTPLAQSRPAIAIEPL